MTEQEAAKIVETELSFICSCNAMIFLCPRRARVIAALLAASEAADKQGRSDVSTGEPPCPECRMDTRFHADDCKYHQTKYAEGYEEGYERARAEGLESSACAVKIIDDLVDQQAMPDNFYVADLERLRALITKPPAAGDEKP